MNRYIRVVTIFGVVVFAAIFLLLCGRQKPDDQEDTAPEGMIYIPAGEFVMGTTSEQEQWLKDKGWWINWMKNEQPAHKVYLDAYYIDKYEVTNAQYREFMKATEKAKTEDWNDSQFNQPNQPVVGVTWYDAEAYCTWAGKRLPTEAEWEKAARGTDGRQFPWGNEEPTCEYAIIGTQDIMGCGETRPWPVGSRPIGGSPYGAHDMAGNVWEWVNDWYDERYYLRSPNRNPTGPKSGENKVLRGGSWYSHTSSYLRVAYRIRANPDVRNRRIVGFRCARAP